MSKVHYYAAMSLDGYIAESDDTLDWLIKYEGSYEGPATDAGGYDEFFEGIGALIMGSATYEWLLGEVSTWPYPDTPTWVLSSRELPPPPGAEDADVRFVAATPDDLIDDLRSAAGDRDIWVVGGGNVASQFADAGLIDHVEVTVVPVVLGSGKPLFDRRLPGGPMQLREVMPRPSGMVELRYDVRRGA